MGCHLCSVWILSAPAARSLCPHCTRCPVSSPPRSLKWGPPQAGSPLSTEAPRLSPAWCHLVSQHSASARLALPATATRHALGSDLQAPVHALIPHLQTGRSLLTRNSEPCAPVKTQDDLPFPESFPRQELVQLAFILSVCLSSLLSFLPLPPSFPITHTHTLIPTHSHSHTLMRTHRHSRSHTQTHTHTHTHACNHL